MANELQFQRNVVLKFITDQVYGLGYKLVSANTIDTRLVIDEDIISFLQTPQNQTNYELALKDYKGNEKQFHKDYIEEVEKQAYKRQNISFFFRDKTVNLKTPNGNSYQFIIFNTSSFKMGNYDPSQDQLFSQNIFSVVEELTLQVSEENINYHIRPDLSFFLNGLFIGYIELKKEPQTAVKDGRGKVLKDYIKAVDLYTHNNNDFSEVRSKALRVFEKGLHISAMDRNETYLLRVPASYFTEIQKYSNHASKLEITSKILSEFKYVPFKKSANQADNFKEVLKNLYSKLSIENEILYFNFLKKDYVKENDKVATKTTTGGVHMAPRPNQKFGVDKIVDRICELYLYENDDEYIIRELERQLDSHSMNQISPDKKKEILDNRRKQNNNRSLFSILGQYSAGFGKTNIMCWLSLRLKDILQQNGEYLFNRILLVTDRVDLRDQLDLNMHNMNIEKSLFQEAETKAELESILKDSKARIVIVNVQKFPNIKDILSNDLIENIKKERVCFIIDEIHRSQSGSLNQEMSNLFDQVADSIPGKREKKNTVVGLTATASDEVLVRFGEYNSCIDKDLQWKPFDCYTMRDAIDDGFVLDPTQYLIPVAVKMEFDEVDEDEVENYKAPSKEDIYNNKERIYAISEKIVSYCLRSTFKKIKGRGKAMVKAYSIEAAKMFKDAIDKQLDKQLEDRKYTAYQDTKVFIVYSPNQKHESPKSLNGNRSEKEVIRDYKNSKNAIIIVVDKLQTGFDEPTLHTLFLDAEINDINAVQTVCRVNRTTKFKNDCAVIDFSHNNVNIKNIQKAFKKYEHMSVASFDVPGFISSVEKAHSEFKKHSLFKVFYDRFIETIMDAQNDHLFDDFVGQNSNQEILSDFVQKGVLFIDLADKARALLDPASLAHVELDYKTKKYDKFVMRLKYLVNSSVGASDSDKDVVDFWYDNVISETEYFDHDSKQLGKSSGGGSGVKHDPYGLLDKLKKLNETEEKKLVIIKAFQDKMKTVFEKMNLLDETDRVKVILLDENTTMDHSEDEFKKLFKKARRRIKTDTETEDTHFWEVADSAQSQLMEDYKTYIQKKDN